MNQELFDWLLLILRWLHIAAAVSWIGTSVFFMWMDRTFKENSEKKIQNPGHLGELWMVHGGGFYRVEKLQMGITKVPQELHWFKWESYWTWMSGYALLALIFYSGNGTFLLDSSVAQITFTEGILASLFSIFGSWFIYDFLWEHSSTKKNPLFGHILTIIWALLMAYFLCHTLSGRAAYIHFGAMIGTWMTANVFLRIIPRQVKMVEAAIKGETVNADWGKNAKNRSTHNTYLTLPIVFIMLSNHFPSTYGHEYNWIILLGLCLSGACIREYFITRINKPKRSYQFLASGIILLLIMIDFSLQNVNQSVNQNTNQNAKGADDLTDHGQTKISENKNTEEKNHLDQAHPDKEKNIYGTAQISGSINFQGPIPLRKKLSLPSGCHQNNQEAYSSEILINESKVENVLVRITKGLEKFYYDDVPEKTAELDQINCQYTPRLLAVRVGQKVDFINSDPIFHNIKSVTSQNQNFNLGMNEKGQRITMTFDKPDLFLQSKCSVHPWMGAYIAVLDHPFFSATKNNGEYMIGKLPAGHYNLEVWHEVFGTINHEFDIKDGENLKFDFTFNQSNKNKK